MSDIFNNADTLNRVVPRGGAPVTGELKRSFAPWHKPRKQWIRRHQWQAEVVALLARTHFPADARIFRYLSLPGDDLFDVRVLREACAAVGTELRFTGLNTVSAGSRRDIQLNIAESAVRGLERIHPGSKILRERFQSIADADSMAHAEVKSSGPYNAINVDLCDHLALREQDGDAPTIIDALAELIRSQLQHAMHPWVLFVTTRVSPGSVDPRNLTALVRAVTDNMAGSPDFSMQVATMLRAEGDVLQDALSEPNALDPARFKDLFCLGFGKWMLAYISAAMPSRTLSMLPSCFYSVHAGQPDMLSLAFRCDPIHLPPSDPYGLIVAPAAAQEPNELTMAMQLIGEVQSMFDLDASLLQNPALTETLTSESEDLLRLANYPVDDENAYRNWLAGRQAA